MAMREPVDSSAVTSACLCHRMFAGHNIKPPHVSILARLSEVHRDRFALILLKCGLR